MTGYSGGKQGLARLRAKFDGDLIAGVRHSITIKAYRHGEVRAFFRLFNKPRTPERWIFVCGCYNSGTKLLTSILSKHPSISSLPQEGRFLTDAFPDLQKNGWRRMLYANKASWVRSPANAEAVKRRACHDWGRLWNRDAPYFLEKSICHATRLPWLEEVFTEGAERPYFVVIVRDGYCVAESVRRTGIPEGQARELVGERYPLKLCAEQWVALNEELLEFLNGRDNVSLVHMEDLVAEPLETVTRLLQDMGIAVPHLKFENSRLYVENDFDEVRSDLNAARRNSLTAEEIDSIDQIVDPMMRRLDYPARYG